MYLLPSLATGRPDKMSIAIVSKGAPVRTFCSRPCARDVQLCLADNESTVLSNYICRGAYLASSNAGVVVVTYARRLSVLLKGQNVLY